MRKMKFWSFLLLMYLVVPACSSDNETDTVNPDEESRINENVKGSNVEAPASFTTKILVEDYTGTWCGWCPGMAHALEQSILKNSNVIGVGIHCESIDPFEFEHQASMASAFSVDGFPTAIVNRDFKWNEQYEHLSTPFAKTAPLGIGLSTSLDGDLLKGTVKFAFNADVEESLDYVIYLVEEKLVYPQANYYNDDVNSPYYQKGDPMTTFEHASVLRKVATDVLGDVLPEKFTKKGQVCEADFELNLADYNKENCYVIAFVVKKGGHEVVNVQKVKAGASQDFD